MKRYLPYLIGLLAVVALGLLLMGAKKAEERTINQRVSLRQADKIPYGFYAARQLAQELFPGASFSFDNKKPGYWDSLTVTGSRQAVFLIGDLNADDEELEEMQQFVKNGNFVFIISKSLSYDAIAFFGFESKDLHSDNDIISMGNDSLKIRLSPPRFTDQTIYTYPGKRYAGHFTYIAPETAVVLGRNASGHANFVQFKAGRGAVFIHTAPLAFSNYFVLHKDNVHYFEQALSVIPADVEKVVWNEYYLVKKYKDTKEDEPNWLGVLFKYPSFKWALLTAIFTLLLYVLLEMRRRQRVIPDYSRPHNASLEFVQTIGRLYYSRSDHADLARKMSVYFLEHVRLKYKLVTNELDEDFMASLAYKSGYPEKDINSIINFIQFVSKEKVISEGQLAAFHNEVEKFYQNT